ncbi:hypothetical protein FHG87_005944 [Trinorchestia longiramus]|nr:hypothetical protein FHG87_005944 [Trinorchestia longiramus]
MQQVAALCNTAQHNSAQHRAQSYEDLLQFTRRCRRRPKAQASLRSTELGSSGRTALDIPHRSSFHPLRKPSMHRDCSSHDLQHYGYQYVYEMTARQEKRFLRSSSTRHSGGSTSCSYEHATGSSEMGSHHQTTCVKGNKETIVLL